MGRYAHAASKISGPMFVMSGGCGRDGSLLSDGWLCDSNNQWIKVFHNVQFSYNHVNLKYLKATIIGGYKIKRFLKIMKLADIILSI